jgi:hypothetical protein
MSPYYKDPDPAEPETGWNPSKPSSKLKIYEEHCSNPNSSMMSIGEHHE